MDFQGPTSADYDNLRSLNVAFLELVQRRKPSCLEGLPAELRRRLQRLSRREIGWLAAVPFLLFSFRERDDSFWQRLLDDDNCQDLFTIPISSTDETGRLVSAGLGFVWQLATHNPFAARMLCGASTHWCEQIAERTFFYILAVAGRRADLLVLRAQDDTCLWRKLLVDGLCQEAAARRAVHISALQSILTRQSTSTSWQAAACSSRNPTLKVVEDS